MAFTGVTSIMVETVKNVVLTVAVVSIIGAAWCR